MAINCQSTQDCLSNGQGGGVQSAFDIPTANNEVSYIYYYHGIINIIYENCVYQDSLVNKATSYSTENTKNNRASYFF